MLIGKSIRRLEKGTKGPDSEDFGLGNDLQALQSYDLPDYRDEVKPTALVFGINESSGIAYIWAVEKN